MPDVNHVMLFTNNQKTKPNAPDWYGRGYVEGPDGNVYAVELAAWNKESQRAGHFLSVNVNVSKEASPDPRDVVSGRKNP